MRHLSNLLAVLLLVAPGILAPPAFADSSSAETLRQALADLEGRLSSLPSADSEDLPAARAELGELAAECHRRLGRLKLSAGRGEVQAFRSTWFKRLQRLAERASGAGQLRSVRAEVAWQLDAASRSLRRWDEAAPRYLERKAQFEQAHAEMKEILEADEFQVSRDRLGELTRLFGTRLDELFRWLGVSERDVGTYAQVFMRLILVGSAALSAWVVTRWLLRRMRDRAARHPARSEPVEEVRRLESPEAHAEAAKRAVASGNLREAIHHEYLMLLSALERRHLVVLDRTRTNWEYQRRLLALGQTGPARRLADLNGLYDRKWYGGEPVTAEDTRTFDRLARSLMTEVGYETA